jgi:hypothetical protein
LDWGSAEALAGEDVEVVAPALEPLDLGLDSGFSIGHLLSIIDHALAASSAAAAPLSEPWWVAARLRTNWVRNSALVSIGISVVALDLLGVDHLEGAKVAGEVAYEPVAGLFGAVALDPETHGLPIATGVHGVSGVVDAGVTVTLVAA